MTPFHSDWQIHAATTVTNVETRDIFVRCPLHCFYINLHPNLQINGVRDYIMSGASSVLQRRCCTLTTRFPSRCRQCPVWRLVPFGDWYDAISGKPQPFRNRPVVGGHLMLLIIPTLA